MVRVRPLTLLDLERLEAFDAPLASRDRRPTWITRGSVQTFERTGHAFVAEHGRGSVAEIAGFVLAMTSWDGNRPTVRVTALVVGGSGAPAGLDGDVVREALFEALTKSAYDAAVYDLVAEIPASDDGTQAVATAAGWTRDDVVVLRRTLGSRGG